MSPKQQTIHVELRAPDALLRAQLAEALVTDGEFSIANPDDPKRDIVLAHAGSLPRAGPQARELAHDAPLVVACAPDDPVELAGLLASGVRGYHCVGEPWSKLREVLRLVHEGSVRSDPGPMNELLLMYSRLLREASWRDAQSVIQPNGRK